MTIADTCWSVRANKPGYDQARAAAFLLSVLVTGLPASAFAETVAPQNFIPNSSFEIISDSNPIFWYPNQDVIEQYGSLDAWRPNWGLDTAEKWHGRQSVRMSGKFRKELCLQTHVPKKESMAFSFHARSGGPDLPLRIEFKGKGYKTFPFIIGKDWKRYETSIDSGGGRLQLKFICSQAGSLWIDAVQLEEAEKPTQYHADAITKDRRQMASTGGFGLGSPVRITPGILTGPPEINGVVDRKEWDKAAIIELKEHLGTPLKRPSRARIGVCDETLYLAFECEGGKAKPAASASLRNRFLRDDESRIEFYLEPHPGAKSFHRFQVSPEGVWCDSQGFAPAWNSGGHAAVGENEGGWCAEVSIPLDAFIRSPLLRDTWGFGFTRYSAEVDELSIWPTPEYRYHISRNDWAFLEWPKPGPLDRFAIEISDAELLETGKGKARLRINVRNHSGKERSLVGAACRRYGKDSELKRSQVQTIPADDESWFEVDGFEFPGQTEWPMRIVMFDDDRAVFERTEYVNVKPMLDLYLDRSYYSSETEAVLHGEVVPSIRRLGLRLMLGDKEVSQSDVLIEKPKVVVRLPIKNLVDGAYALEAIGRDEKSEALCQRRLPLQKISRLSGESKIDHHRRQVLINDEPQLIFMPCFMTYSDPGKRTMQFLADAGFKSVIIAIGTPHVPRIAEYMRLAGESGLRAGLYTSQAAIIPRIRELRKLSEVFIYLVVDEPTKGENKIIEAVAQMRKADPNRLAWCNQLFNHGIERRLAGLPGDIISTDYYPVGSPNRRIIDLGYMVERMETAARRRRLPTWMWLAWGGANMNHAREPTPDEQTAQVYECITAGASGIVFFIGPPVGPKHWQRLKDLNREMERLAPAILSRESVKQATVNNPFVRVTTRKKGNSIYVIAVNGMPSPCRARFNLSELPVNDSGKAEVVFENRSAGFQRGVLEARFAGYQRHVFRLSLPAGQ